MNLMFTAVTFVAFTALVAIISWWKTRGDNLDTQDGYYLAGRGLTGPVIAGSLLMTNLSAEQLVGNNGQAVRIGMSPMGWEVTSAIALVILAFVLMPKYLKTGLTTVPEFFEQRYDAGTRRLVSFIVLLSYIIIMLPNVLYAGAQVFVNIFGIDQVFVTQFGMDAGSARFWAIAAVCVATAFAGSIYAIFGGLKAIAVSDSINGLGLIVGGLLVPIFGLIALGAAHGGGFKEGLDAFLTTDKTLLNAIDAPNLNEPYLAAAADRSAGQQHVLLGNQPVHHPAYLRCKEPEGSTEGCCSGRFLQDPHPADHRCTGCYRTPAVHRGYRLGQRRYCIPDAGCRRYAQVAARLLRSCYVRRNPVVV